MSDLDYACVLFLVSCYATKPEEPNRYAFEPTEISTLTESKMTLGEMGSKYLVPIKGIDRRFTIDQAIKHFRPEYSHLVRAAVEELHMGYYA